MQTLQADYFGAYRNLKLSRDDKGVLVAEFHSDGGPFIINAQAHTELAFWRRGWDSNPLRIDDGTAVQRVR